MKSFMLRPDLGPVYAALALAITVAACVFLK
jgi:hypothetical protein